MEGHFGFSGRPNRGFRPKAESAPEAPKKEAREAKSGEKERGRKKEGEQGQFVSLFELQTCPKIKGKLHRQVKKHFFFRLRRQGTKKHAKKSNDKRILRAKFAAVRRRKFSGDLFALKISRNAARRAAKIFGRPNRGFWASTRRKATEPWSEKNYIQKQDI